VKFPPVPLVPDTLSYHVYVGVGYPSAEHVNVDPPSTGEAGGVMAIDDGSGQ
jgi:hypothetical protein